MYRYKIYLLDAFFPTGLNFFLFMEGKNGLILRKIYANYKLRTKDVLANILHLLFVLFCFAQKFQNADF